MIPWLSLGFESVVAVLMIAMIVYAVKLNRRLVGLRERDAEMQDMITRFIIGALLDLPERIRLDECVVLVGAGLVDRERRRDTHGRHREGALHDTILELVVGPLAAAGLDELVEDLLGLR